MADFSVNLAQPQGAGAKVVAPVSPAVEYQTDSVTPWVALGANLTGVLAQNMHDKEIKTKELKKQAVIAEFTQKQTAIADAVQRGMPTAMAQAKSQSNFSQYAATYPALVSDFKSNNAALFENTGLANVKSDTDMLKDAQKQTVQDMVKAGYPITAGISPETLVSWQNTFQTTRRAEVDLDKKIKAASFSNSQNAEQRSQFNFDLKNEVARTLTEVGSQHLNSAQLFVQDSINKARAGNPQEAINDVTKYFSNIQGTLGAVSSQHPELAGQWNKMFGDLQKAAMDGIEGKATSEALKSQLENIKNKSQLMALSNPEMQGLYAVSALTNGNLASLYVSSNKIALDTMQVLGGKPLSPTNKVGPQIIGNTAIEKDVFTMVKDQVKALESNQALDPVQTKQQLTNVTNHALKQVEQAMSNGLTSQDLTTSASFFASPEYAKIVSYGLVDKQKASLANQVFQVSYKKDVVNGIEQELSRPISFNSSDKPLSFGSLVNFEWAGAGIQVTSAYDKYLNPMEKQNRDQIIRETQTASAGINQLIHMGAHMEGHTDYQKYWDENKHNILPNMYPDPAVLKPGQSVDGYKYLGGNTRSLSSWEKEDLSKKNNEVTPASTTKTDPYDFSNKYNTQLTPSEEKSFEKWAKDNHKTKDAYDYDIRGAWKELTSGTMTQADNGHLGDKYKKPNHPTFSDQSSYHGTDGAVGGKWDEVNGKTRFTPSQTNLTNMNKKQLKEYFSKYEKGVILNVD